MPKYILTIHGRAFRVATYNDARVALSRRYPEARIDHAPKDTDMRLDGLGLAAFEAEYHHKPEAVTTRMGFPRYVRKAAQ